MFEGKLPNNADQPTTPDHPMTYPSADQTKLCVSLTPLQVLIASRVSEECGLKFDLGLYISCQRDDKNEHYFKKMSTFCKKTEFILTPVETYPKGIKKYVTLFKRRQQFLKLFATFGKYSYVLAGSSISHYLWAAVQAASPKVLETYDDGLFNILTEPASRYQKMRFSENLFLRMCGLKMHKDKMIQQSSKHYSVYREKNWFSRVCYVPLFAETTSSLSSLGSTRQLDIFLGPGPEAPESIWRVIENFLIANPDTTYFRHPRDDGKKFGFAKTLHTNLIIEDYVVQEMNNPGTTITVTGTETTALFNLSKIKHICAQSILPNVPEFVESRKLMRKHGVALVFAD